MGRFLSCKIYIVLLALVVFTQNTLQAQIRTNRSWQVNAFNDSIGDEKRFFGSLMFAAEANHGWFSKEEALTWTIRYQGFMELYRWGDRSMIGFYLGHELHANPFNDIYFNPRAAFWNESLSFYHQLPSLTFQVGVEHRCRHDIDNIDPPSPALADNYQGLGRILVLNSIILGIQSNQININRALSLQTSGSFYYYLYTEDSRTPAENQTGSWENIYASTSLAYSLKYNISDFLQLYQRSNLDYVIMDEVEMPINARLELGITMKGHKGQLNIFSGYEYFFDDVTLPTPRQSSMIFAGIRGSSLAFF